MWGDIFNAVTRPFLIPSIYVPLILAILGFVADRYLLRMSRSFLDLLTNLAVFWVGYTLLFLSTYIWPVLQYMFEFRLFDHEEFPLDWLLCYISVDFFYYWRHRAQHSFKFLWAFGHSVHHSSQELNASTALRLPWTDYIYFWVFLIPPVLLGFDPKMVMGSFAVNMVYQFIIHIKISVNLGWLEYIINTPNHHRVHHQECEKCLGKNLAGSFIFWDHVFNTFQPNDHHCSFGAGYRLKTHNPLTLHLWPFAQYLKSRKIWFS